MVNKGIKGDLPYIPPEAPEVFECQQATLKGDFWAIGCML